MQADTLHLGMAAGPGAKAFFTYPRATNPGGAGARPFAYGLGVVTWLHPPPIVPQLAFVLTKRCGSPQPLYR